MTVSSLRSGCPDRAPPALVAGCLFVRRELVRIGYSRVFSKLALSGPGHTFSFQSPIGEVLRLNAMEIRVHEVGQASAKKESPSRGLKVQFARSRS